MQDDVDEALYELHQIACDGRSYTSSLDGYYWLVKKELEELREYKRKNEKMVLEFKEIAGKFMGMQQELQELRNYKLEKEFMH